MKHEFSRIRRFAVAASALLCAGMLFRSQIAQALVIRGDGYMYRGENVRALERYRRALAIAPLSQTAADRYVFVSMQRPSAGSLHAALAAANAYLDARPNDAVLLADRALCYLHARRYASAERDFERAARASHAANDYVFAGWAAEHAGRRRSAIALWRAALRVQPHYRPAMFALARTLR